jgi:hypothetical protein
MEVANTLAYYDTVTITAIKRFLVQAPADLDHACPSQIGKKSFLKL